MRRVRTAKLSRHAHDGAAFRRGRGECEVPPLEIGVWAIQLSPYRAGLAGPHRTRLPMSPAFPTGSCSLQLSPSGESMTQESLFELLLTLSRMQHRVPRRTVSLHPAQASQRPCDGPVSSYTTEFIPIKSWVARGSGAPGNCAGRNRAPSPDRGRPPSTD